MIFASPEINKRVYDEMGIKKLISPYGLTETHIGGTVCEMDDPLELRMTTVGRPMPGVEMGIRQPEGKDFLPAGEPGEVCFKGWCVTKGYFDDPQKTAEALDDEGWFRTGDLGVIGGDGYVRLVGRIKDMIRVGGENVAAADVEAVLLKHDAVKQAVAVGMANDRLVEVVAVFVELKTGKQGNRARDHGLLPPAPRQLQSPAPGGVRKRLAHDRRGQNPALCLERIPRARSDA